MLFYKIIVTVDGNETLPHNRSDAGYESLVNILNTKSEDDYQRCGHAHYFFATNISDKAINFVAIFKTKVDTVSEFENFIRQTDLKIKDISLEETLLRQTRITVKLAQHRNLFTDSDAIFKGFGINDLYSDYSETLLDGNIAKDDLITKSKAMLLEETLLPEIERIYTESPVSRVKGHPVHYLVCCDDRNKQKEICRILLEALYANKRIQSKRISYVDFDSNDSLPNRSYDAFYKSYESGTVIVHYTPLEDRKSNGVRPDENLIADLCDTAKKYRNSVLTVFCIPSECSKTKDYFLEQLISLPLVELSEDKASGERAKEYLRNLAEECDIRPDKQLYRSLEDDKKLYCASQLRQIFDEWYNHQLLHRVYPQYEAVRISTSEVIKSKPKGSAIDKLNKMIGLTEAKAIISRALDFYKVQKLYKDKGLSADKPVMHMVFTGNPGTAKTTVARLFAEIMRDNGLLTKGDLYEVGRADLVGKYVGWTAQIVKDKFKEAKGSVLFIDEAYSLLDDKDSLYGDEAINTIVQEMENNRDNMIVIFAGYPDKMEQFLNRNPGLRSRIAFHVPFHDYDTDELVAIAELTAQEMNLHFTPESHSRLCEILEAARNSEDFGNGRYVRNLIEQARMEQASRIVQMDYEEVTEETLNTLTEEDIPSFGVPHTKEKHRIGFSA